MDFWCEPGDILLYFDAPDLVTRLIDDGERLEDTNEAQYPYHVAIALGRYDKIEAQGKNVAIASIDYGRFTVYRPPIPKPYINDGLAEIRKYIGQPYDYWLILDIALRDLTRDRLHLPTKFIQSTERRAKICSSLAVKYLSAAQWGPKFKMYASPEDIWMAVRNYALAEVKV